MALFLLIVPICCNSSSNVHNVRNKGTNYKPHIVKSVYKSKPIYVPTEEDCLALAIYHEARSESLRGQKAVLSVINNRMRLFGETACEVVRKPSQFSWTRKHKNWKATEGMLDRLDVLAFMESSVVSNRTIYFATKPQDWGKHSQKIGRHFFQE